MPGTPQACARRCTAAVVEIRPGLHQLGLISSFAVSLACVIMLRTGHTGGREHTSQESVLWTDAR